MISFEAALTANVPGFMYGECLLSCTAEKVAKMQPKAYATTQNKTDTLYVVHLNAANNNLSQDQNASTISDTSITAYPSQDDMETAEELDYKPEEVDLIKEVSEEIREERRRSSLRRKEQKKKKL